MKKMKYKLSLVIFTFIILNGCVAQWALVTDKNQTITQSGISISLPLGWVTISPRKTLQLTSFDGPSLNMITIETIKLKDIEKELKIKLPDDMDMLFTSKQFIAFWSRKTGISEFTVSSNNYIEQNGHDFFKVEWFFKDESGVTVKNISQGTIIAGELVNVGYSAPKIHYYNKSFNDFNVLLGSMKR